MLVEEAPEVCTLLLLLLGTGQFYPYSSGLLHCHWGNHTGAIIWLPQWQWNIPEVYRSCESTKNWWYHWVPLWLDKLFLKKQEAYRPKEFCSSYKAMLPACINWITIYKTKNHSWIYNIDKRHPIAPPHGWIIGYLLSIFTANNSCRTFVKQMQSDILENDELVIMGLSFITTTKQSTTKLCLCLWNAFYIVLI